MLTHDLGDIQTHPPFGTISQDLELRASTLEVLRLVELILDFPNCVRNDVFRPEHDSVPGIIGVGLIQRQKCGRRCTGEEKQRKAWRGFWRMLPKILDKV